MSATRWVGAAVAALTLAGCATTAPAQPEVALAAPGSGAATPIDSVPMTVGTTYRFADVLPSVLDVEVTIPAREIYAYDLQMYAILAGDAEGDIDVVSFVSADDVTVESDPQRIDRSPDDPPDGTVYAPLGEVLPTLAALPFLEVMVPARPLTVAGVEATAVDVRVPELPAGAHLCDNDLRCAPLLQAGGYGQYVVSGQELRLAQLDLAAGRVLVVQNLQEPRAEQVLAATRFVERPLPAELAGARRLPYTSDVVAPGQRYADVLTGAGVGVTFAMGDVPFVGFAIDGALVSALDPDTLDLTGDFTAVRFGGYPEIGDVFGYVAPTADLVVPEPGVDPRMTMTPATDGIVDEAGLVDEIAAQPWAEVLDGPSDVVVAGLPGRSVDVRLRAGGGAVLCLTDRPDSGVCAALVYSRASPYSVMLGDRALRVAEVTVGGESVTVITSTDDGGRAFADSLSLVEIAG